jgi:GNAT superfamily N-acetyltransferase
MKANPNLAHAHAPIPRTAVVLADGTPVSIRPVSTRDVRRERAFLLRLPPEDRAFRFLGVIESDLGHAAEELTRIDPQTDVSLAAVVGDDGDEREVGVACYRTSADGRHCDCAVAIDPQWQRLGLGIALMSRLIEIARSRGVHRMYSADAARCHGTHRLAERLGFRERPDPEDPVVVTFELALR